MKNATIYDVAKKASCSTATVSLVLANDKRIQPKTAARVMDAVEKLGYTPNYSAKSLSKKRTDTLGLIVPNVENPLFSTMISGIESYTNSNDFDLILGISNSDRKKELFYLDMLQTKRVDGLIVFPTFINSIAERIANSSQLPPIVLCGSSGSKINNVSYAKCNNQLGAFLATKHLIENGCKKIACVFPVDDTSQCRSRYSGYCEAMNGAGLEVKKEMICICKSDNKSIFESSTNLINTKKPDAIFCLCDYHAIIVMRAIESLGLKIPTDIQLIGFDNINISSFLTTSLSTIDTNAAKVGQVAAQLLIEKINNPDAPIQQIIIEPTLVKRSSTCCKE